MPKIRRLFARLGAALPRGFSSRTCVALEGDTHGHIECVASVPWRWRWRATAGAVETTGQARGLGRAIADANDALAQLAATPPATTPRGAVTEATSVEPAVVPPPPPPAEPSATRAVAPARAGTLTRVRTAARRRLPNPRFWIEQTGGVRIVCRPGRPGSGYRWSVTDLSARSSGTASSFDDAIGQARAAVDELVRPAQYADVIEATACFLREQGDDRRAVLLFHIAQDLRGTTADE